MLDDVFGEKLGERVFVFGSSSRIVSLRSGREIVSLPLSQLAELSCDPAIFLHFAFMTRDRVSEMSLESFIAGNRGISDIVKKAARRIGAKGFFLPSSGAVYRQDHSIDDDMERNPYGVLKYQDEISFRELCESGEGLFVVGRVFNLAGPFVNKLDTYALSSIIGNVQRGNPVEIRAAHRVIRSYVHVGDVLDIVFSCLTTPDSSAAPVFFDTVGEEKIEIGDLAARVALVLGRPESKIIRPPWDDSRTDIYLGNEVAFGELIQQYDIKLRSLDQQIFDTADYLAQN
jgi:nucleoside-diphosphate-sugar epimerase